MTGEEIHPHLIPLPSRERRSNEIATPLARNDSKKGSQ